MSSAAAKAGKCIQRDTNVYRSGLGPVVPLVGAKEEKVARRNAEPLYHGSRTRASCSIAGHTRERNQARLFDDQHRIDSPMQELSFQRLPMLGAKVYKNSRRNSLILGHSPSADRYILSSAQRDAACH